MPDGEWWHALQVLCDAARAQHETEKRREGREWLIILLLEVIYLLLAILVGKLVWW